MSPSDSMRRDADRSELPTVERLQGLRGEPPELVDLLGDAVFALDAEGRVRYMNRRCVRLFGGEPEDVVGSPLSVWLPERVAQRAERLVERLLAEDRTRGVFGFQVTDSDGEGRMYEAQVTVLTDAAGAFRGSVGVVSDVTELATARREMERESDALRELYEVAGRGDLELSERIERLLEIGCRRLGLSAGFLTEISDGAQRVLVAVGDHPELRVGEEAPLDATDPSRYVGGEVEVRGERVGTLCFADVRDGGETVGQVEENFVRMLVQWVSRELERQRLLDEMTALARKDELTGLANRRVLEERLAAEVERSRRYGDALSLLLIDLDHFKRVNDRLGHPAGDTALRAVGAILTRETRATDLPARYGGEEFAVLLPETDCEGAIVQAERIVREVRDLTVRHEEVEFSLTASIGVAELAGDDAEGLVERADAALYRAKEGGRDRVVAAR